MEQPTCSIVRDLLPLYEEQAVSLETNDFVKQHLESCEDCSNYHQNLIDDAKQQEKINEQLTSETLHMADIAKKIRKRRRRIVCTVVASFLVFCFLLSLFFNTAINDGNSMEPTYANNTTLLINKAAYLFHGPKNNDIVVFTMPGGSWINRIIAGPGDTVSYESGYLLVNGTSKETAEWCGKTTNSGDQTYPLTLKEDEYFVIGDSLEDSYDSRYEGCGFIKRSQIRGKVLCRWISLSSLFTRTTVTTATESMPGN
ncbi:signal peptidase I [Anaerosporobacter sp.]